jgi:hypothetical protein
MYDEVQLEIGGHVCTVPTAVIDIFRLPRLPINACDGRLLEELGFAKASAEALARSGPFLSLDQAVRAVDDAASRDLLQSHFFVEPKLEQLAEHFRDQVVTHTRKGNSRLRNLPPPPPGTEVVLHTDSRSGPRVAKVEAIEGRQWRFAEGEKTLTLEPAAAAGWGDTRQTRLVTAAALGISEEKLEDLISASPGTFARVGEFFITGGESRIRDRLTAALLHVATLPAPQQGLALAYLRDQARLGTPFMFNIAGRGSHNVNGPGPKGIGLGPEASFDTLIHEANHSTLFDFYRGVPERELPPEYQGGDGFLYLVDEFQARLVGQRAADGVIEHPLATAEVIVDRYGGRASERQRESFLELVQASVRHQRPILDELRVQIRERSPGENGELPAIPNWAH